MVEITARELAEVTGGRLIASETDARRVASGVTIDSRNVVDGEIFFAFGGEHVDGNDYCAAAIRSGAGAVVATREPSEGVTALAGEFACPLVVVDDAGEAMWALAGWWRRKLRAIVVGVTGSVGKTTTKDLVASVLSRRYKTHATEGNHNNELGVPLTILTADLDTEALVVEMGMRGEGQIASLAGLAHPGIGVVTTIGWSHIELLGSREAIARAKGELLESLPKRGTAVVNADDEMTGALLAQMGEGGARVLSFGLGESGGAGESGGGDAADEQNRISATGSGGSHRLGESGESLGTPDVTARSISFDEAGCATFSLVAEGAGSADVTLALAGLHAVRNALAAAAVGVALGLDVTDIACGLSQTRPAGMRMQIEKSPAGATIVNDAYNANPDSMLAALDTLAEMSCAGRRVAVLGDMGELGDLAADLHREVGAHAASLSSAGALDELVCVGELAGHIADGAVDAGMPAESVCRFETVGAASEYLCGEGGPRRGDVVIVKASRFMELERLAERLVS